MNIRGTWTLFLHEQPELYSEILDFLKLEEVRYRTITIVDSFAAVPLLTWDWIQDNHKEFWDRFDQQFMGRLAQGPLLKK